MDWKRFQEPSFIAAALGCVLLLLLLALRPGQASPDRQAIQALDASIEASVARLTALEENVSNLATSISQREDSDSRSPGGNVVDGPGLGDFEEAISMTKTHLDAGEFTPAFDTLMVASRLAPSDPRLFNLVVLFVEQAMPSENEEVVFLAENLLDRGDSLVHFQHPKDVASARKRLNELRQSFPAPATPIAIPSPLESVRKLVFVATNSSVPLSVRTRAAEQARSAFEDIRLDQALASVEQPGQVQSVELKQLDAQIDDAEKQCIKDLFDQSKPKIDGWLKTVSALTGKIDSVPSEKVPGLSEKIVNLVAQGMEALQEVMPYSQSGVEGASDLSREVNRQVKLLQRQKDWLYNQQALRLVREIESKEDWTSEDKIRHLAEVREEMLSPYVLRRHNELWEKVFETLPDEDKKVWAVRLRILRLNE